MDIQKSCRNQELEAAFDGHLHFIEADILYVEDEIVELPDLKIPHPRIYMRKFALIPLAELNSNKVDPISNKTIQQLLEECQDQLEVRKFNPVGQKNA